MINIGFENKEVVHIKGDKTSDLSAKRKEKVLRDLSYWYKYTSMLGFARMIKEKLPLRLRLFTNVYADKKWLDNRSNVIRVYYSYKSYAKVKNGKRFCYEFTLDDLELEANGKKLITKNK